MEPHDYNIENKLNTREPLIDDCSENFITCQKAYFDFFMKFDFNKLKECLTILPKGSLIFHGTKVKDTILPNNPICSNNMTATSQILSCESYNKYIGTLNHKSKDGTGTDYQAEINEYKIRAKQAINDGINIGSSFFWANTTIDANIMVDSRQMKSMTVFIAKRDIILINYFKIQSIINNNNKSIFKGSIRMPASYNKDNKDDPDEEGQWTGVLNIPDLPNIQLRNKYKNTIGDSTYIQLLNYIFALKGYIRVSGYADYDAVDATPNIYDTGSNIYGEYNVYNEYTKSYDKKFVCKEIMLLDPSKYLTYLGHHKIDFVENDLLRTKQNLWTSLQNKLNNLVHTQTTKFYNIVWKDKDDTLLGKVYQGITLFPHYRYEFESPDMIDNFISFIVSDAKNLSINNDNKPTQWNPFEKIQKGGVSDNTSYDKELVDILSHIKTLSANTSNNVYNHATYADLFKKLKETDDLSDTTEVTDESKQLLREKEKFDIKSKLSDACTKILHSEPVIHQMCIEQIKQMCDRINKDTEIITKINRILSIQPNTYTNISDIFIFYLKGSSALDIVINKQYANFKTSNKDLYDKSDLTQSDFDINVCINPAIMEHTNYAAVKQYIITYFTTQLVQIKTAFQTKFDEIYRIKIFKKINKKLFDTDNTENKIIVKNMNYAFPRFEQDDKIINDNKTYTSDTVYDCIKISYIQDLGGDTTNKQFKINKFSLLRLKLTAQSGVQYLSCHGELIDISIIDDMDEAQYTWDHNKSVIMCAGIYVYDLTGLYMDLNNTLLNSLAMGISKKYEKRLARLELMEKIICDTFDENNDIFDKQNKYGQITKDNICDTTLQPQIATNIYNRLKDNNDETLQLNENKLYKMFDYINTYKQPSFTKYIFNKRNITDTNIDKSHIDMCRVVESISLELYTKYFSQYTTYTKTIKDSKHIIHLQCYADEPDYINLQKIIYSIKTNTSHNYLLWYFKKIINKDDITIQNNIMININNLYEIHVFTINITINTKYVKRISRQQDGGKSYEIKTQLIHPKYIQLNTDNKHTPITNIRSPTDIQQYITNHTYNDHIAITNIIHTNESLHITNYIISMIYPIEIHEQSYDNIYKLILGNLACIYTYEQTKEPLSIAGGSYNAYLNHRNKYKKLYYISS